MNDKQDAGNKDSAAVDPFSPAQLGPVTLPNRFVKAATFEGLSYEGKVTQELVDFHREYIRGGVGMTTLAFCAVSPDGRSTDRHQMLWTREGLPGMRKLTSAIHSENGAIAAQIGHAGPVANPKANQRPALAPSRHFHATTTSFTKPATKDELARVVREHGDAAAMAVEAGFDAVEIHLGHNYLVSSFTSPKLNRRDDEYGGSLANRARLAREVTRAVRDAVGDRIAIIAKVNMDDGAPGGFWLNEAIQLTRWLEQDGSVDALEMTVGSSLRNPMYLFKGDVPMEDFSAAMPPLIKFGMKLFGKALLKPYPYRDAFLLDQARQIRAEVNLPMMLVGGVTGRDVVDQAMGEGFEFVAMARALLREPDLVNRMRSEENARSLCIHCNKCMPSIYHGGTHCVLVQTQGPRSAEWGQNSLV